VIIGHRMEGAKGCPPDVPLGRVALTSISRVASISSFFDFPYDRKKALLEKADNSNSLIGHGIAGAKGCSAGPSTSLAPFHFPRTCLPCEMVVPSLNVPKF
jgi:hypothetical protein